MCLSVVGIANSPQMGGKRTASPPGGHTGPPLRTKGKMSRVPPPLWKGGLPCGERKEYSILHVLPYRRRGGPMCPPVADITNSP